MSKELRAVRDGATHTIGAPYTKIGGVWTPATKVYRKEAGAWVEWWPLKPLPPTTLALTFPYLNDNIEMALSWVAPASGTAPASYNVTISIPGMETIAFNTTLLTYHPTTAFQAYAGQPCTVSIACVSGSGKVGDAAVVTVQVSQLPPPPTPTGVTLALANRSATTTWAHVAGNRLSSFELRTSYGALTKDSTATKPTRSQDVTFWPTASVPGDPGGPVGSMVRAVGPGGTSDWASASGATLPNVPNLPPPVVVQVPGAATITNHRFLGGVLRCDYSCTNATGAKAWWQKNQEGWVSLGNVAASGSITVAGSNAWPADQLNGYRIIIQGTNGGGAGTAVGGQHCIKLPNPYYITPVDTIAVRHDARYNDGYMRQGGSYNEWNYHAPIIRWKSYAVYGNHITTAMTRGRVGYDLTITKGEILLWRKNSAGSGQGVRPRLWYHTYVNPGDVPMSIYPTLHAGHDLEPFNRDEAKWQTLNLDYARSLVLDPNGVNGVAIYHPNTVLLGYLGEVSAEYLMMHGQGMSIYGIPMWTLLIHHDG